MNILLTCAGRRHYLAQYFKDFLGDNGMLFCADLSATAPALAGCDRAILTPAVDSPIYIQTLIAICNKYSIDYVFSLNDLELQLLADNKHILEENTKSKFVISSSNVIHRCADKFETFRFCNELGISSPKTYIDLNLAKKALHAGEIEFPLMVKPRWGSASIGLFKCVDLSELEASFSRCLHSVLNSQLSSLGNNTAPVVIQEFIQGPEYGVDILNDLEGSYIGFTAKRKLAMRAGETDKSITVAPEPFKSAAESIANQLRHIGNLDCDFIEKNGTYYLLEMNPRFGGGYPFTHVAGANHIAHLLDKTPNNPKKYSYTPNKTYAKCDILVDLSDISVTNIREQLEFLHD